MKTISTISGISTRYDVKSKCKVVEHLLTQEYKDKKHLNTVIENIAESLMVNPVTVKLWIHKYQHTYKEGLKLPDGVMSYSPLVIDEKDLVYVKRKLKIVKNKINTIKKEHEKTLSKVSAKTLREGTKKPSELLNKLIGETK